MKWHTDPHTLWRTDPMMAALTEHSSAFAFMVVAVKLERIVVQMCFDRSFFTQPATPHIKVCDNTHPAIWRAMAATPYVAIEEADLAELP